MSTILKKIEYLKKIFAGIKLNVRSKLGDEIEDMFSEDTNYQSLYREPRESDLIISLKILEAALKDAKKEFKEAKKEVKLGKLNSSYLQSYKNAVDELIQQIKEIKSSLNG